MNPVATPPPDVRLMNMTASALVVAFMVLGLGAVARAVSHLPMFDIRRISIAGPLEHSNEVTLKANVGTRTQGSFFSVDLARVQAAFESVPWVRRAVVHRGFPNQLQVELQEHVVAGYWGGDDDARLINSYGEVFEANVGEVDQDTLPRLLGPEGQSAEVLTMYRVVAPLFARMEMPVEQLELTGRGSWRTRLDTGAEIELGRGSPEEVVARTHRFLKTLTQVTSRYGRQVNAVDAADLRHENGYAVRLRGISTVATDSSKK